MINAALVEAIKQLITLLLIIALLFSPANALAGVNPVSEIDKENGNCTNDHSNSSNDQDNTGSIDNNTKGDNNGSSDHGTSGQNNSNLETVSTLTPGDSETSLSGSGKDSSFINSAGDDGVQKNPDEKIGSELDVSSEQVPDPESSYSISENNDLALNVETDGKEETGPNSGQQEENSLDVIYNTDQIEDDEKQPPNDNDLSTTTKSTSFNSDTSSGGNSYIATVIPEEGKVVKQGEATALTVTFTELGNTSLGSAQLFIPKSLDVDTGQEVEISSGWAYKWEDPVEDSTFSRVLSIWALLDGDNNNYLRKNDSVSATFIATAKSDQTHHFDTKAWQEAELNCEGTEQIGVCKDDSKINNYFGYDSASGQYEESNSQPKINVWVDSAGDGYRTTGEESPALSMDGARDLNDGNLYIGLDNIRDNLNWHYVQVEDIELADYLNSDGPGYNADAGWEPVGSESDCFYGSYYGNDLIIDGLKIDRDSTDYVGLFGFISGGAVINNVSLSNVNITGKAHVGSLVGENRNSVILNSSAQGTVTGVGSNVGGLVGRNNRVNRDDINLGIIDNCFAQVQVTGLNYVGGLVGNNMADAEIENSSAGKENDQSVLTVTGDSSVGGLAGKNDGVIANSFATTEVVSTGNNEVLLGGLIGHNNTGSVINSYASGEVKTANGERVGGLIGMNSSSKNVENCYALGNVTGIKFIGGLIGLDNGSGSIVNSYAVGQVSGDPQIGGLIGHQSAGSITNSYYLNDATSNNAIGEPKSEEELFEINTFSGWSIDYIDNIESTDHIWYIDDGNAYPILWWQYEKGCADNDGNDGNGENGDTPPDDEQDGSDEDGEQDKSTENDSEGAPGGNNNMRWPSSGLGNYSPGNNNYVINQTLPPNVIANRSDGYPLTEHLLIFIMDESENPPEAIINPDFVSEGNWEDYRSVLSAYENLIDLFEANKNNLSSQEYATAIIDLAIAYAAIRIVEARLLGLEKDYENALQAYEEALSTFEEFSILLNEDQFSLATEILIAIESLLHEWI